MKLPLFAACILAGFFSLPLTTAALAQSDAEAAPIKVYAGGEITPDRYTVVKHLWTEDFSSAFYVPTYPNSAEGISALVAAARGRRQRDGQRLLSGRAKRAIGDG